MSSGLLRMFLISLTYYFFFFQAEDGIRDWSVTGVQTCALPILLDDAAGEVLGRDQADGWEPVVGDEEEHEDVARVRCGEVVQARAHLPRAGPVGAKARDRRALAITLASAQPTAVEVELDVHRTTAAK